MKKKISEAIRKSQKIALSSHVRPDADCIGSGLALYIMLSQMGKDVVFYNTDKAPFPLTELPQFNVIEYKQIHPNPFDAVILIEGGTEDRTGQINIQDYFTINIDHHITSANDADLNWVVPEAAAVGELIFELGHELGIRFTRDIGLNLYAAISSDTGSFKYSNTTARSLKIASELVEISGFTPTEASNLLFNSNPFEKIQMIEKVLSTIELEHNKTVAVIHFKTSFLKNLSLSEIETEDVISIARSIIGVRVTLFLKEIGDNYFRVSIRSKGGISSKQVAQVYNGGGHDHAAGFFFKGDLETAKKEILQVIEQQY